MVGPVQTNCYFAINDETKELIIIDPGYSPKQLAERVRQEGCTPVAILLTHGHFDHATGAANRPLREQVQDSTPNRFRTEANGKRKHKKEASLHREASFLYRK